MKKRIKKITIMLGSSLTALAAMQFTCSGAPTEDTSTDTLVLDANGRPVGWIDTTHSKKVNPDYDAVFPQSEVRRIDVTISAADWQTMLDDMTDLYGTFGQGNRGPTGGPTTPPAGAGANPVMPPNGPGGGVAPPAEMLDACDALQAGDACSVTFDEMTVSGTCMAQPDGQLACVPAGDPGAGGGVAPPANGGVPNNGGVLDGGNMPLENDTNPVVVPCTVSCNGETWWYVGIRFKGNSSLMSTWGSGIYKLPYKLDFDAFDEEHPEVDGQRFYGFEKLSLASNWSDPTYLREKVTHDVFRAAGVPAPRTAFYRLYIDHGEGATYFGLYAMTEVPDKPMLETQFGDDSGNLYKPTSTWVSFSQDDFDKENNKDAADWSDVQAAITALNADRSDPAAWRAGLEAVFNVDGFLRWLAVNTVIQNWDTYGRMAHNYYLYANPSDGGRLTWIPWDNNMAFMAGMGGGMGAPGGGAGGDSGLSMGLSEVGESWPLIRYLLDDPVYHAAYVAHVRAFVTHVYDVAAIQARFQAAHDLIAPYVIGIEGEQTGYTLLNSPQEFETGLSSLLQFVASRYEAANAYLSTQP